MRCKGYHFPAIGYSLNMNSLVNHGFRYMGIPFPPVAGVPPCYQGILTVGLGCCPYHRAHIRLVFIRHGLTALINYSGRTNIRPFSHINPVAGYRNQGSGRSSIIINKYPHRNLTIEYQTSQRISIHHHSAISIHIY